MIDFFIFILKREIKICFLNLFQFFFIFFYIKIEISFSFKNIVLNLNIRDKIYFYVFLCVLFLYNSFMFCSFLRDLNIYVWRRWGFILLEKLHGNFFSSIFFLFFFSLEINRFGYTGAKRFFYNAGVFRFTLKRIG